MELVFTGCFFDVIMNQTSNRFTTIIQKVDDLLQLFKSRSKVHESNMSGELAFNFYQR